VYLFHNHPTSGSLYEPIGKRVAAVRSRMAEDSLPLRRGQQNSLHKSSRESSRRYAHSYANTCLSCCFKRAPSLLPVRMPVAWLRCSGPRRTSTGYLET
jgi:hypothetical protein